MSHRIEAAKEIMSLVGVTKKIPLRFFKPTVESGMGDIFEPYIDRWFKDYDIELIAPLAERNRLCQVWMN